MITALWIFVGSVVAVGIGVGIAAYREARDLHLRPSELEQGCDECGDRHE